MNNSFFNLQSWKKKLPFVGSSRKLGLDEGDVFAHVKEQFSPAVVNIEVTFLRDFGLAGAGASKATGFIVDKEQGIILTNKHVVGEGPCRAKGVFLKNEEIDLLPIHRDFVHDFGFFKFDPSELKDTPLTQIDLFPQGAKPGVKGILISNNDGERHMYIETTVSRVDRPASQGLDLNTFYIATSDTSVEGSSGSPLLNKDGKCIGLMASGTERGGNVSFLLPLERVARVLEYILKDKEAPRGTLQVSFKYQNFEALLTRGSITEDMIVHSKTENEQANGFLLVDKKLPKGPGTLAGLMNGDIILSVNNSSVYNFIDLADIMDTFIGKQVKVTVLRNLQKVELIATIQDHKDIAVTELIELSNGIFHELPYEMALSDNQAMEGVFITKSGYMFDSVTPLSIITMIGKQKIRHLKDFVEVIKSFENGQLVPVKYRECWEQNILHRTLVTVDKRWYPFQIATRDDKAGKWKYKDIIDDLSLSKRESREIIIKRSESKQSSGENTLLAEEDILVKAIVGLRISKPFSLSGESFTSESKLTGVIVNKTVGLIVCENQEVSESLMDVQVVFNGSRIIPAKVVFISAEDQVPVSFLKYDPELLNNDPATSLEEVVLDSSKPSIGDTLYKIAVVDGNELVSGDMKVLSIRNGRTEFCEMTGTAVRGGGIFIDKATRKVKLVQTGHQTPLYACDLKPIADELIDCFQNNKKLPSEQFSLPVSMQFISLAEARINYLSTQWVLKLQNSMTPYQQKLCSIETRMVTSDAHDKLSENDIVLAIDNKPAAQMHDMFKMLSGKKSVKITVLRDSEELTVDVKLTSFPTLSTIRVLFFAGMVLQDPDKRVYFSTKPEFVKGGGVYVAHRERGCPAESAESAGEEVVAIVGKLLFQVGDFPVSNLEELVKVVHNFDHDQFVRVYARDLSNGEEIFLDIRLDLEYWKTREMFLDENNDWKSKFLTQDAT